MMDIKKLAVECGAKDYKTYTNKTCDWTGKKLYEKAGYSFTFEQLETFAKALQQSEPVAKVLGDDGTGGYVIDYLKPLKGGDKLYTTPPVQSEPVTLMAIKIARLEDRNAVLEDLLSSAFNIANRKGKNTHWTRFAERLHINGINPITPKTFKILPSDEEYTTPPATVPLEKYNKLLEEANEFKDSIGKDNTILLSTQYRRFVKAIAEAEEK